MPTDLTPITGTGSMEIEQHVGLDPRAEVRFDHDSDSLTLTMSDGRTEVFMDLPDSPDAWLLVQSLARRIEALIPEVRLRTLGYRPEHGPFNGPGVLGPARRTSPGRFPAEGM